MAMSVPGPIVTARWLKKALASVRAGNPKITVVDGSYILPKRDLRKAWEDSRIPGARFFDIDAVCDSTTQSTSSTCRGSGGAACLPHMLPSASVFSDWCVDNGIEPADTERAIVVYDSHEQGIFGSPRVAWTFNCFGFGNVAVLDGGLKMWKETGGDVESGPSERVETVATGDHGATERDATLVATIDDVKRASGDGGQRVQILDARSSARFNGDQPEPREGLLSGHIPNSMNVPFMSLRCAP